MDFNTRYARLSNQQAVDYIHGSLLVLLGREQGENRASEMRTAQIMAGRRPAAFMDVAKRRHKYHNDSCIGEDTHF